MLAVIVIPTFNEKNNIRTLVEKIFHILPNGIILIVDDNSPDGTGKIADKLSKECSQVKVLHREKKCGLGKACIAGLRKALEIKPDCIIQMDGDFSHNPKYLPHFLTEIEKFDVVLGSRFVNANGIPPNVTILSIWAKHYAAKMLGLNVSDCMGGFKCFRRKVVEDIGLDRFISSGFIFHAEFIYRASKQGFTIKEVPIIFDERYSGKSKKSISIIGEAFFKILFLRLAVR